MKDAIFTLMEVAGGLGLFLFGMKLMGEGLENAAGDKLKSILEKVTKNPISAVFSWCICYNGNTKFKRYYGNGSWFC